MGIIIHPNNAETPIIVNLVPVEQEDNYIKCDWECDGKEADTLIFTPNSESDKTFHIIFHFQGNPVTHGCLKSPLKNGATMEPSLVVIRNLFPPHWPPKNTDGFTEIPGGCLVIGSGTSDDTDNLAFGYDGKVLDPRVKIGGTTN
ncbi:hypothetical protein [Sessilibacter corallicola]|uniref:Uncharacterized protein n=1 Tax=Sessilibacter corallicola TaxID=2904075 RepID=A0ABQ0AE45_9GAMM